MRRGWGFLGCTIMSLELFFSLAWRWHFGGRDVRYGEVERWEGRARVCEMHSLRL